MGIQNGPSPNSTLIWRLMAVKRSRGPILHVVAIFFARQLANSGTRGFCDAATCSGGAEKYVYDGASHCRHCRRHCGRLCRQNNWTSIRVLSAILKSQFNLGDACRIHVHVSGIVRNCATIPLDWPRMSSVLLRRRVVIVPGQYMIIHVMYGMVAERARAGVVLVPRMVSYRGAEARDGVHVSV